MPCASVSALPLEVQRELESAVPAEDLLFSLAKLSTSSPNYLLSQNPQYWTEYGSCVTGVLFKSA